jgi:hypothetical protein
MNGTATRPDVPAHMKGLKETVMTSMASSGTLSRIKVCVEQAFGAYEREHQSIARETAHLQHRAQLHNSRRQS